MIMKKFSKQMCFVQLEKLRETVDKKYKLDKSRINTYKYGSLIQKKKKKKSGARDSQKFNQTSPLV